MILSVSLILLQPGIYVAILPGVANTTGKYGSEKIY